MLLKIWAWIKKNWLWLLIVPTVILAVLWIIRWVIIMFTNIGGPNLTDLERDLRNDMERMSDEEKKVLEKIREDNEKLKDGIDAGDPTPAKIFDNTIRGED